MEQEKKPLEFIEEFPPVSTEAWETLIMQDLKGADYEKKLIWQTAEGLKVKPYYREEHLNDLKTQHTLPCESPFVRGNNKNGNHWLIRQEIAEDKPDDANVKAVNALAKGAQSVALNVSSCTSYKDVTALLKDIDLATADVHFYGASSYLQFVKFLRNACEELGLPNDKLKGSLNFDSLGYFLAHGTFYASIDSNFVELQQLIGMVKKDFPLLKFINVNAHRVHNAGGLLTQEMAVALSIGVEYLSQLTSKGENIDEVAAGMTFTLAIGSNYFLEIAKIRAMRMLWSAIVNAYAPQKEISKYMHIHSITGSWNKTIYDPHVNMLRATTEAMSAAVGGCDVMSILPFDNVYKKSDRFSERISRNLQIILKEEAYFDKIVDAAAGSYYVENLTYALAEAAWQLFLEIDAKGGYIKYAQSGELMELIDKSAMLKQDELAKRKVTLLGTNQFPNNNEEMLSRIEPMTGAVKLTALKEKRLSQHFEALRLATEDFVKRGNEIPKVFLLTIGNPAMRKARATFSMNFFGCAGFKIIDNNGFGTVDDAVKSALESKADIIVLCSSDEEYDTIGCDITKGIKETSPKVIVVVAGNPADAIDRLKKAGVDEFIHMRSNVLQTLQNFSSSMGII